MSQRIQLRRGIASAWASANPILSLAEPGIETDTGLFKFGDGNTHWSSLTYSGASANVASPNGSGGNDTGLIADALARVGANGSGFILLDEGVYSVNPGTLAVPNTLTGGISIRGQGRGVTTIQRTGNGILLDISGPSQASPLTDITVSDLTLDGNGMTGAITRSYYTHNGMYTNLGWINSGDRMMDAVQMWDSRFMDCYANYQNDLTAVPMFHFRNAVTNTGFGASTDNCNQIMFSNFRWEAFTNNALRIERGTGTNTNNPNGFYLNNCKMESTRIAAPCLWVADGNARFILVGDLYVSGDGLGAGATAQNAIQWGINQFGTLRDVVINESIAGVFSNGVDLNANETVLDGIFGTYVTTTGSHIQADGGGPYPASGLAQSGKTTMIGGVAAAQVIQSSTGAGTTAGRTTTTVAYAATVTPAIPTGIDLILNIGQLTGAITVANPTGTLADGQTLTIRFSYNATGGYTITFGSAYVFGTDITQALFPVAASSTWEVTFQYNLASTQWRAMAIVRGF